MTLRSAYFIALVLSVFLLAVPAQAAEDTMAVVDVDKLMIESAAGKSIQKQLEDRREAFKKEFAQKEDELGEANKKLVEEKTTLSPEDFEKKRQAFESRLLETKKKLQKSRNSLDVGEAKAISELQKQIVMVTSDIADKEGYDIVFMRESVVIFDKDLDITPAVMKALNDKVKEIKLEIE